MKENDRIKALPEQTSVKFAQYGGYVAQKALSLLTDLNGLVKTASLSSDFNLKLKTTIPNGGFN